MIVIQQMLENQIALLKKCVEFYADEENYKEPLGDGLSQIDMDGGFLAKEILKTVKNLEDQNQKMSDDFEKYNDLTNQPTVESILAEVQKITNQQE